MPDRAEIRDWVRQHTLVEIDDYADDKIDNVINQGIRDLSTQFSWPYLEATDTITLVSDTASYAVPADFARLQAVVSSESPYKLQEVTAQAAWMRWASDADTDRPQHFYMRADNIIFVPTPSGASLPDITVFYYRQPTVLANDTDEPEFASQFHLVLAEFAAAKVWEREEDLTRSEYYMGRYFAGVETMARYYLNRADDYPLVIGAGTSRTNTSLIPSGRMPWLEV